MPKGIPNRKPLIFLMGGKELIYYSNFWSRYLVNDNECWIWTGPIGDDGYGKVKIAQKTLRSHRVSYALINGDFDQSLMVCHRCDVPLCINPEHLFLGTNSDNQIDSRSKKRGADIRGVKNPAAKLTEVQILEIKKEYIPYVITHTFLAKKYGVCKNHIARIIRGERWGVTI